ncbi:MAG: carboxypeptidase regulatory-like domain-containing protein [Acidobacteria bacterium]|nr:carboxypeptidase regulatory-like domain-containing protein [Acidobacteriota bacterium]
MVLATTLYAQTVTLRGQVVDEVGAVIPNAEITLTSKDGKERTAKSGVTGEFSIPNIPAGVYKLTSSFQGFQPYFNNELTVPVQAGLLTVTMMVATVNVVEDVNANSQIVSTEPDQNIECHYSRRGIYQEPA